MTDLGEPRVADTAAALIPPPEATPILRRGSPRAAGLRCPGPAPWSAADDAFLVAHWGAPGWPSRAIATHLGRTKNAIIGRKNRLGLAPVRASVRPKTTKPPKAPAPYKPVVHVDLYSADELRRRQAARFAVTRRDATPERPVWHPARDPKPEWLRRA